MSKIAKNTQLQSCMAAQIPSLYEWEKYNEYDVCLFVVFTTATSQCTSEI